MSGGHQPLGYSPGKEQERTECATLSPSSNSETGDDGSYTLRLVAPLLPACGPRGGCLRVMVLNLNQQEGGCVYQDVPPSYHTQGGIYTRRYLSP